MAGILWQLVALKIQASFQLLKSNVVMCAVFMAGSPIKEVILEDFKGIDDG